MSRNIVLDTNCLVQIISAHSPYRPAWQAFREGRYILCVSNDILNEYAEILERVANAAVAHNIVNAIARSPYTRMFDPHFRILETIPFPSVNVRRLEEFLLDLQG